MFRSSLTKMTMLAGAMVLPLFAHAQNAQQPQQQNMSAEEQAQVQADAALASRFSQIAQATMASRRIEDIEFKEFAALTQAASRLHPNNPMYLRNLVEAQLQFRDTTAAIDTLRKYIATMDSFHEPDLVAQVRLMDLFASTLESAEQKLSHYQAIAGAAQIADDVRSCAAVRVARLMEERMQHEQASAAIDQALKLEPYNIEALQLAEQRARSRTPQEHVSCRVVHRCQHHQRSHGKCSRS
jgi:tetratricopeptide (TPR) repeat protein